MLNNNQKHIGIFIIDEFDNIEENLGYFGTKDIEFLINEAAKNNIKCLPFIDLHANTYFNELQVAEINKSFNLLQKNTSLDHKLIVAIKKGINYVQNNSFTFLMFASIDQ